MRILTVLAALWLTVALALGQSCPPNLIVTNQSLGDNGPIYRYWVYSATQQASWTVTYKWEITAMPDPSRSSQASTVVTSGQHSFTTSLSAGCTSIMIPFQRLNTTQIGYWDNYGLTSSTNGYYKLEAYVIVGGIKYYAANPVYAFIREGVWMWDPPGSETGWTPIYTSEYTEGNDPDQSLRVTVMRDGALVSSGCTVTLRRNDGQTSTVSTVNGLAKWNSVQPGPYELTLGGTAQEGTNTVTYSGTLDIVKPDGRFDVKILTNSQGSAESVVGNSGSGGSDEQPSWLQGFFTSLFIPSQESVQAVQDELGEMTAWGPFGLIQQINGAENIQASAKMSLALPVYTKDQGWQTCESCKIDASPITNTSTWQAIRSWLGIGVYLGVLGFAVKALMPRQVV